MVIPPPEQPKYAGKVIGLNAQVPKLPDDFCALVDRYGSGEFSDERRGCIVELHNPLHSWDRESADGLHKIHREFRDAEGVPAYLIYPEMPGLLLWGWSDQRESYFWKAVGEPNAWTVLYFADMSDSYEFNMPMVVFLQQLQFGQIHRRDLGYAEPDYDPSKIKFERTFR